MLDINKLLYGINNEILFYQLFNIYFQIRNLS